MREVTYINDLDRISHDMGQFQIWCGKLFYWHSMRLGWRFLKDV